MPALFQDTAKWWINGNARGGDERAATSWREDVCRPHPAFFQRSPEYHGVLSAWNGGRLIVSPNGKRYCIQILDGSGSEFEVIAWRKRLALLLPQLPEHVARWAVQALPDDPTEFDRPWARAMDERRQAFREGAPFSDDYSGEIARHGSVRVIVAPGGAQYWLQTCDKDARWYVRRCSDTSDDLRLSVVATGRSPRTGGFVVLSDRLATVVEALPQLPGDWQGG